MTQAILIDCDVVFRTDVKFLFEQFKKFTPENLFGLAPELTPVYRHILYKYRATYPKSTFGNPYYPQGHRKSQKLGYPGLNSGVVMLQLDRIRASKLYTESLTFDNVKHLTDKYSFKGHLGDQDFFTLLGYEFPALIYRLDCIWNRQLCTWWKEHGYSDVFDQFFHCEGKIKLYHGNCNTRVPEWIEPIWQYVHTPFKYPPFYSFLQHCDNFFRCRVQENKFLIFFYLSMRISVFPNTKSIALQMQLNCVQFKG